MTRRCAGRRNGLRAIALLAVALHAVAMGAARQAGAAASEKPGETKVTEVRAAVGLPPTHPVVAEGWRTFEQVATSAPDSGLKFRLFINGAVLGASGGLEPLSQGDADLGLVVPARYPEQFPFTGYVTELALASENGMAAAAAMTEQVLLGCQPCADEFLGQGLVFLGTYSAPPYVLISRARIDTPASLKGRNVLTPGTIWDRWVASLGARPVHEPALGAAVSGVKPPAPDASIDVALALNQVNPAQGPHFLTPLHLGGYRGASPFTVNRSFWRALNVKQRAMLLEGAAAGIVAATEAYEEQARSVIASAADKGVTVVKPDAALDRLVRGMAEQDGERAAGVAREREGIVDADEILAQYRSLYAKYDGLFRTATGEDRVRILSREIYAKIDVGRFAAIPSTDEAEAKKK